eukprot:TRINITY_DN67725_c0_g1_i1.p1 TRINITY_DN67725_c0_g1~~TRINITY_DN67725_c0_g1_i1.p1  ORF type:complete len:1358 (-),score=171.89 TRINITY_DN67725_c0_g1_i1:199-4272(-)
MSWTFVRHTPRKLLSSPWAIAAPALVLVVAPRCVVADPHIFADLDDAAVAQRNHSECDAQSILECSTEYQVGRFNGAQHHLSVDSESAILLRLVPPKVNLLVLITSVWQNRQRRHLLRSAMRSCTAGVERDSVVWRFLLGACPADAAVRRSAAKEVAANSDMLMLSTEDTMNYTHVGDAYELKDPNPELIKIVLGLRFLSQSIDFKYLLVADDDSFVNIRTAVELTWLLPADRVYVGNMIDSIPQRYDPKIGTIRAEYSVSVYLATPSKLPVFAHGMGFLVSRDVGRLLAHVGLSFKARGNDDMLIGVWLRSIEHLHFLHYWPFFHDHWEFGGVFSRPCDETSVIVHRMTPHRWRTFDAWSCHLCGPEHNVSAETFHEETAQESLLSSEPASAFNVSSSTHREVTGICIRPSELVCAWTPSLMESARGNFMSCVHTCLRQAWANFTLPFDDHAAVVAARFHSQRQRSRRSTSRGGDFSSGNTCPSALCHALCQPPGGFVNSLCPGGGTGGVVRSRARRSGRLRSRPELAVLVFGSRWIADSEMRQLLRTALRTCTSVRLGTRGSVQHLFVMTALPTLRNPDARRSAAEEMLRWGDMAIAANSRTSPSQGKPLCVKPTKWCSHIGATFSARDCDGDGIFDSVCVDDQGRAGFISSSRNCTDTWPHEDCEAPEASSYAYAEAWRLVEEHFGDADFIMYLDHRSYVNVPYIAHVVVPSLRRTNIYVGCLLDETLFGSCSGKENRRCDYLVRRRAPMFAHGMGFIVSSDVARFVDGLSAHVPLREDDVPADVAFGMWVQTMEGLNYDSVHTHFHEWHVNGWSTPYDGPGITGHGLDLSLPLKDDSGIVFPMTIERWRAAFDPFTCHLTPPKTRASVATIPSPSGFGRGGSVNAMAIDGATTDVSRSAFPIPVVSPVVSTPSASMAMKRMASSALASSPGSQAGQATASLSIETSPMASQPSLSSGPDCWQAMGSRPESWHLVCCEISWAGCWGGEFTEQLCCRDLPPPGQALLPSPSSDRDLVADFSPGLETLRRFLNFSRDELHLLLIELGTIVANRSKDSAVAGSAKAPVAGSRKSPMPPRFRCLAPKDCAREAFARLYQHFWSSGLLPLRHPWLTDVQDHLFGVLMKLRAENDGWAPKGHEHTFERVQLAEWLRLCSSHIQSSDVPGGWRCLEWDSGRMSRKFFGGLCLHVDLIVYDEPRHPSAITSDTGYKQYFVDIHRAEEIIPSSSFGIVVCTQIFEHLRKPHIAMEQIFRIVVPGGFVVWSAPLFSEIHGAPDDYFRYTPMGAKVLAEDAGFFVDGLFAPGGLKELAGYFLGMTALYWPEAELLAQSSSQWPLQVYMLLRKPKVERNTSAGPVG